MDLKTQEALGNTSKVNIFILKKKETYMAEEGKKRKKHRKTLNTKPEEMDHLQTLNHLDKKASFLLSSVLSTH